MPFKSKAQMRYLYSQHKDVAKRFASYGVPKNLPEHVKKPKKKRHGKLSEALRNS
jgi:hypothetical protein